MTDVIVIGGGLNGLVAGAWLALRKRSVTILDQRPEPGGTAITSEFAPGFRAPTLSHALGPISRAVMKALRLDHAGLEFHAPDPALTTIGRNGRTIVFHRDPVLTAASINAASPADAGRWADFLRVTHRVAGVIGELHQHSAPDIDQMSSRDWWRLLSVGRRARALGKQDLSRLLRWTPMAVADLTSEFFEDELLQAAIAAHAIFGNPAGPWSAGTGGMLLQRLAADPVPVGSGATVSGGPGALTAALAKLAASRGVQLRQGARVVRVLSSHGRATGVVLDSGEELSARVVVAAIDPKHVFADLVDPIEVPPTFRQRIGHIRARGVTAKINLALSGAPVVPAFAGDPLLLRGRVIVAPDLDYLERAFDATKYGEMSVEPWLDISIPTMTDGTLAPERQHVMSVVVHFTPRTLRLGTWIDRREELYVSVLRVLEPIVPALNGLIVERQIITPEDLETTWGLSGGHIFHGESTLDQTWAARPLLGWSQYRTPLAGLFLASAGTHPGGGLTGNSGLLAAHTVDRALTAMKKSKSA